MEITTYNDEQTKTIKNSLMPEGATDTELKLFIMQCVRTKLDPFSRQIYATKIQNKLSVQATIDGFRLIAERSDKYEGQTLPLYMNQKGVWNEVWIGTKEEPYPTACKVGVYKQGFREPLYAIAKWSSYVQMTYKGVGFMWAKMPEVMLAKVAEALALRKAFPNDLSGIYSSEEMAQADDKGEVKMPVNAIKVEEVKESVKEVKEPVKEDMPTIQIDEPKNMSEFYYEVDKAIDGYIALGDVGRLKNAQDKIPVSPKLNQEERELLLPKIIKAINSLTGL